MSPTTTPVADTDLASRLAPLFSGQLLKGEASQLEHHATQRFGDAQQLHVRFFKEAGEGARIALPTRELLRNVLEGLERKLQLRITRVLRDQLESLGVIVFETETAALAA